MDYKECYRNILKRIYSEENRERYIKLFFRRNPDEDRLYMLCSRFNGNNRDTFPIENFDVLDRDIVVAQCDLKEIEELLDKLGWEKIDCFCAAIIVMLNWCSR